MFGDHSVICLSVVYLALLLLSVGNNAVPPPLVKTIQDCIDESKNPIYEVFDEESAKELLGNDRGDHIDLEFNPRFRQLRLFYSEKTLKKENTESDQHPHAHSVCKNTIVKKDGRLVLKHQWDEGYKCNLNTILARKEEWCYRKLENLLCLAWSSDERFIATSDSKERKIKIWKKKEPESEHCHQWKKYKVIGSNSPVVSFEFSADGETIVTENIDDDKVKHRFCSIKRKETICVTKPRFKYMVQFSQECPYSQDTYESINGRCTISDAENYGEKTGIEKNSIKENGHYKSQLKGFSSGGDIEDIKGMKKELCESKLIKELLQVCDGE